jgi:penicillin-binding protein 2
MLHFANVYFLSEVSHIVGTIIDSGEAGSSQRRDVLRAVIIILFSLLFLRLYQLQLLYHEEFGKKSEENSVRAILDEPVRGYMYDRNGKLVVDVGPAYSITVLPASFDTANSPLLSSVLDVDKQALQERIVRGKTFSRFMPVRIKRDVDFPMLSAVEENLYLLPGINYDVESKRLYLPEVRASHLLGYCKEISDAQLERFGSIYQQGDLVGSTGLEASYEPFLRGEKGYQYISVNSKGQTLGPLEGGSRDVPSKDGFDLLLTVDIGLQAYAESLMTARRGALVAIDPNDGGILAMVSEPDFDLSTFSGVTSADQWSQLNNDPDKPLFNRATMTRYPPGSTFKMLVAAAALQEGIIDENWHVTCTGGFRYGNRIFKDTHHHGTMNVVTAIQHSCDVFFYQLVLKVGLDKLYEYGERFGFGEKTGVDIGEEVSGLVPSPQYYDRVYGKGKWTQGYVVSLGIGQGEVGASPLQMARYTAAFANGGTLHQPHAVNAIRNKRTNHIDVIDHKTSSVGLNPHVMELLREGMRRVVENGTGVSAKISGMESAGKTGTAENPHGKDHSWYVGFAPFDNPKIAVAVLVENAGFGAAVAAPIAGKIMQRYLTGSAPAVPAHPAATSVKPKLKQKTTASRW